MKKYLTILAGVLSFAANAAVLADPFNPKHFAWTPASVGEFASRENNAGMLTDPDGFRRMRVRANGMVLSYEWVHPSLASSQFPYMPSKNSTKETYIAVCSNASIKTMIDGGVIIRNYYYGVDHALTDTSELSADICTERTSGKGTSITSRAAQLYAASQPLTTEQPRNNGIRAKWTESALKQYAQEGNNAPSVVDAEGFKRTNVSANRMTLTYSFTNVAKNKTQLAYMANKSLPPNATFRACTEAPMKLMLMSGVRFAYVYYGLEGVVVGSAHLSAKDCAQYASQNKG